MTAALAYLALVILAWGAFGPSSGMPTETQFVIASEQSHGLAGFISADRTRPQCETFYHLAYMLGRAAGCKGSFAPYQWVYAALWWARGLLVFVVLRTLLRGHALFCHVAACLVLVHSSDRSINWVGQLNQFGFMFWLLVATASFARAWLPGPPSRRRALMTLAFFAEYMTLWSYESPIFIALAVPWIVKIALGGRRRGLTIAWYVLPAIWVAWTALRYGSPAGAATYQATVLRKDWGATSLLGDWAWNAARSLSFWTWSDELLWSPALGTATLRAALAVAVFVASSAVLARGTGARLLPERRVLVATACVSAFVLVASFPAYLLLASARVPWRTQMLSSLGAGVFTCAAFSFAASLLRRELLVVAALVVAGSVSVFSGTHAAVLLGAYHHDAWLAHERPVARLLELAPRLVPDTVVVMTGVDEKKDPFTNGLWFDFAVRLAYPRAPVTGVYFHRSGGIPELSLSSFHDRGCYWNELGVSPVRLEPGTSRIGGMGSVIAFTCDGSGRIEVAERLPPELGDTVAARDYHPRERIAPGGPARDAMRRYMER